jgi:hypothetical protein
VLIVIGVLRFVEITYHFGQAVTHQVECLLGGFRCCLAWFSSLNRACARVLPLNTVLDKLGSGEKFFQKDVMMHNTESLVFELI